MFIHSITTINPRHSNNKTVVYMLGYGGRLWQVRRHLKLLSDQGYTLFVMDFKKVLHMDNPQCLIQLVDEVDDVLINSGFIAADVIIIGISMGGLIGFNMLKRHKELNKLLIITGGDISHVPPKRMLNKWGLTRQALMELWRDVNMYTAPGSVKNKHIVMLLPKRDKVIDPQEVMDEISRLSAFNKMTLVRTAGGHFRTIIATTILHPKDTLSYIKDLERS